MSQKTTYYNALLRIAAPIVAQNFISSSLNILDVTMLGQLGETAVASVGIANQIFFLMVLMLFGAYSGQAVFAAQYWGKGDLPSVRKVLGIGLLIGLTGSLLFSVAVLALPEQLLGIYTQDTAVIAQGARYLRIVGWSYMITAVTFAFSSVLRSTGFVRVPMMVSITALGLKTVLNFGLILGHFGLPALGAEGAAISTLIARVLECILLLSVVYWRKLPPAARLREMFGFDGVFVRRVLKTSLPVLINEVLWSFGVNMYTIIYAHIGTAAIAAINISAAIENLAFVVFMGISDATGILIGNRIGAGQENDAFDYARRTLMITTTGAILIGLVILLGADRILSLYKLSAESMANARNILTVVGFLLWIRVTNMTLIIGVLRAGGDTRFGMFLDAGTVWVVGVPLAAVAGLLLNQPVHIVYLLVMCEEAVKCIVAFRRFLSRRWIHNLVHAT